MVETLLQVLDEVYALRPSAQRGCVPGFEEANATGN